MIKRSFAILVFVFQVILLYSQGCPVIPAPKECSLSQTIYIVAKDFTVSVKAPDSSRVYSAATRMLKRLKDRTGLFINQYKVNGEIQSASLSIVADRNGKCKLGEDESYQLSIDSSKIVLKAATDLGALHGIVMPCFFALSQFDELYRELFAGTTALDALRLLVNNVREEGYDLGLAMDDMAVAPTVYQRAKEKGLGVWLPL